jgi:adenylate cyclase
VAQDESENRPEDTGSSEEQREQRGRLSRAARRLDKQPKLLTAAKLARELLPGDSRFGDPLSTGGREGAHVAGRRLSALTAERPGVSRELGLTALQVWQALSEVQGRGHGDEDLTILFTDIADYSTWALEAGDELALELLRDVCQAIEPPIEDHGGEIVKRLGDGVMAVFPDAQSAVAATFAGQERLQDVDVAGHRPRLRAGIHLGRPRKLGGDYLGVDVNVAARLTEQADADEVLVSDRVLEQIDSDGIEAKKLRRFKAKGAPSEMTAYALKPAG